MAQFGGVTTQEAEAGVSHGQSQSAQHDKTVSQKQYKAKQKYLNKVIEIAGVLKMGAHRSFSCIILIVRI